MGGILAQNRAMRRKIEIIVFEQTRLVSRTAARPACAVCGQATELLTTAQAAALCQVTRRRVRRWLAEGRAHGVRTAGGQLRVCRASLFFRSARSGNFRIDS
jgi:excisionase family DNA binding protein